MESLGLFPGEERTDHRDADADDRHHQKAKDHCRSLLVGEKGMDEPGQDEKNKGMGK